MRRRRNQHARRVRDAHRPPRGAGISGRRRFDNLHVELSVALGVGLPRFNLWMELHEWDIDPERLTREQVIAFCDGPLQCYLRKCGLSLRRRALRRLCRKLGKYDPTIVTPYERFAALP
jgi:hypothetical protein